MGTAPSAPHILLAFMACWMLLEVAKHEMQRRECAYCGERNGHRQDCPLDHVEQNS